VATPDIYSPLCKYIVKVFKIFRYNENMSKIESPHPEEQHKSHRGNWLRAGVLGVNDGVVSVASLMLGVLTANANNSAF
jgi:VIT1/CCC1 family predicted Fe2+/Mn2+ transporter